jgi:acetylornithine/succinyldiaminopimelate/putrescine aminotransferase
MNTIQFTPQSFAQFKRLKAEAEAAGKDSFTFEGKEVLCAYAKYVIEYVESQVGDRK